MTFLPAKVPPATLHLHEGHFTRYLHKGITFRIFALRRESAEWTAFFGRQDASSTLYVNAWAWSFWSVFDGHVGQETAMDLATNLNMDIASALEPMYQDQDPLEPPEAETIHHIVKDVFMKVDDEIVTKRAQYIAEQPAGDPVKGLAAILLQAARSGSCALVAFYETNVRRLHVAVVGDSRAVLGRRRTTPSGAAVYDVHVLSVDHTAQNPTEAARLKAEHPGEVLVDKNGRFLGQGFTRSFGDGVLKWSREMQTFLHEKCLGDKPRTMLRTPPYLTALPEITTTIVESGDFLVVSTDGLWDNLTNEEVVGLVGLWLEQTGEGKGKDVIERGDLPVVLKPDSERDAKKRFVNESSNAAHHLARNALGGADKDLHTALVSTPAPRARQLRDDITAFVVFFD
ncbi:phosphatase 2C-like domain-containing protein [Mycena crocata]|nr:phosphatase 2C-like domain-containing protein [Mycena crocata]